MLPYMDWICRHFFPIKTEQIPLKFSNFFIRFPFWEKNCFYFSAVVFFWFEQFFFMFLYWYIWMHCWCNYIFIAPWNSTKYIILFSFFIRFPFLNANFHTYLWLKNWWENVLFLVFCIFLKFKFRRNKIS